MYGTANLRYLVAFENQVLGQFHANTSLLHLLVDMHVKQFLLAALACCVWAQDTTTPISCTSVFDTNCCRGKKATAACSFKVADITFYGKCLPATGVSFHFQQV